MKKDGIKVIKLGTGKIASQYPAKAQIISKDDTVVLRAVGDVNASIMKNKSYNEVYGICTVMNWECKLEGIGTASKVENTGNNKYTIKFKVPDAIKPKENKEKDAKNSN